MPKSSNKVVRFGGQERLMALACGKTILGHPNEVNKKYERHVRYCDKCPKDDKAPAFNNKQSYENGKNEVLGKNIMIISVFSKGEGKPTSKQIAKSDDITKWV